MSTDVSSVVSHFPDAENGFLTTTSGSVSSGASTVGLNSVAGYTNGKPVVFVIDPTDANKKQTFTGIIDTSGVQVTNVVWTAGTNQSHALGATVVDYATATHIAMVSKGILVSHKQDGTMISNLPLTTPAIGSAGANFSGSSSGTTALKAAATASGTLTMPAATDTLVGKATTDTLTNKTLTAPVIDQFGTASGLGAAWTSWSPTLANLTVGSGTLVSVYQQVGKTVRGFVKFTYGSGSSVGTSPTISVPVAPHTRYSTGNNIAGIVWADDSGVANYQGTVILTSSVLSPGITITNGALASWGAFAANSPFVWGTADTFNFAFEYEAA